MAGGVGFEPTHARVKVLCLTAWLRPYKMWLFIFFVFKAFAMQMNGVDSEVRTHGIQGHNLALYQLSHIHHMVRLAGVEPTTYALEGRCSILLRYRRINIHHCLRR